MSETIFDVNHTGYSNYRTPFIRVSIGDAKGKNLQPLPPSVARLLEKAEITEVLEGCNHFHTISLTFLEGSREPFNHSQIEDTTSLYPDTHITNHTGMLTDLKFTRSGSGLTSMAADLVGKIQLPSGPALNKLGEVVSTNDIVITGKRKTPQAVNYLFEERNQIQITWGYKENIKETRTIRTYIQVVQSNFPDGDTPSVTIICAPIGTMFDQISPPQGISFQTKELAGVDPEKGDLYTFKDMSIKEVIEQVTKETGLRALVSDNLINTTLDKYHTKTWPVGKSFNQFLKSMAKEANGNYFTITDAQSGENYIVMVSRSDFEKTPIFSSDEKYLFKYRGPNSIIKSVSIKADFSGPSGNIASGYDNNGNSIVRGTTDTQVALTLYDKKTGIDNDPTGHNSPIGITELSNKVAKNSSGVISHGEASPGMNEPQGEHEKTISLEACRRKLISLDFTSLGHSRLRPGSVYFDGIGSRYSGVYNIVTLVHTIDTNGYNCRGTATSWTMNDTLGASPDNAPKTSTTSDQVSLSLVDSKFKTISLGNIGKIDSMTQNDDTSNKLNKLLLGK